MPIAAAPTRLRQIKVALQRPEHAVPPKGSGIRLWGPARGAGSGATALRGGNSGWPGATRPWEGLGVETNDLSSTSGETIARSGRSRQGTTEPRSADALGFSLFPVARRQELLEACAVRAQAYGHHLPELGAALAEPDEIDLHPATTVFLCRDKASGAAVGTMRIQTSIHGPLVLERSVALPARLAASCRAEVTRLAVRVGADPLVKLCLMKASWLFCLAQRVRTMVIGARKDALIRNYRRLGFVDVFADEALRPLAHTGGLLHRILCFDVAGAERAWALQNHPLYVFMVHTRHADLQVGPRLPARTMQAIEGDAFTTSRSHEGLDVEVALREAREAALLPASGAGAPWGLVGPV